MSSFIIDLLNECGVFIKPHLYQIALSLVATALVIFGGAINGAIKKLLQKQHLVIRVTAFVLVCAFGYGLATVWLTSILAAQLGQIPLSYLAPTIVMLFIVLGTYAQKQRHI